MKLKKIKKFIENNGMVLSMILLGFLLTTFGGKGFWGWLTIISLLVVWRLIRSWDTFKEGYQTNLKYVESVIFGKPLDKDMWNKGELKRKKVKVIWQKRKK